jgi:hypothetical protein
MKLASPLYDGDSIIRPTPTLQRRSPEGSSLHERSPRGLFSTDAYVMEVAVSPATWKSFRERIVGLVRRRIAERDARRAARELEATSE